MIGYEAYLIRFIGARLVRPAMLKSFDKTISSGLLSILTYLTCEVI
jgi:hypothetical protein